MASLSILFVTTRFPLPLLSGDRTRAFHQLRLLSRQHRLTLVTFADPARAAARSVLEEHGVRVFTVPLGRFGAACRVARRVWSDLPLQAALFASSRLRDTISSLVAAEHFDLVHVQLARAVPLVGPEIGLPRVVDFVDALSMNMRHRAEHDRLLLRWAAAIVASTPADLAAAVVSVMRDDTLAHRLSTGGRMLVERLYTWERSVADLERLYWSVADRVRPAASDQ